MHTMNIEGGPCLPTRYPLITLSNSLHMSQQTMEAFNAYDTEVGAGLTFYG